MWEIFNPRDGKPVGTTRWQFVARIICRICPVLDFERKGKGYVWL